MPPQFTNSNLDRTGIRTFQMTQYVTGPLPLKISEWPNKMQDKVYAALERLAHRVELPLTITNIVCDKDHGDAVDGSQDKWYVTIYASEIVARDETDERMIERAVQQSIGKVKH